MDNYSKDILSEIQERAFSEGYNQALIEKMYAEEGAKEKEAILDRLKRYGGKVKDLAWGDKWEGNKLRRGVTIGTGAAAAAGLGTLAYLKHKKAKAEAAAEALEEAAEAQREYSAILAERIYSEEEEGKKSGYGKAAARGALGAAGVAGLGYGAGKGIQALNNRRLKKLEDYVDAATDPVMLEKRSDNANINSKLNKASEAITRKEAALAELWNSGKAGKAKILGAAGLALGAGAGIGAGVKKLKDKKNED